MAMVGLGWASLSEECSDSPGSVVTCATFRAGEGWMSSALGLGKPVPAGLLGGEPGVTLQVLPFFISFSCCSCQDCHCQERLGQVPSNLSFQRGRDEEDVIA